MGGSDNIKKVFLKRKRIRRDTRKPILKKVDDYISILVLSETDKRQLRDLIYSNFQNATISFINHRETKKDDSVSTDYTYNIADFSLIGKLKNGKLNQLLQTKFDLVIDLSENELFPLYFLQKLNQTFLVGRGKNEKSILYDLIIENDSDDSDLIITIVQQIKLLCQT